MNREDHCRGCGRLAHGRPQPVEVDDDRCPTCRHQSCICPSLEQVPYGHLRNEPGYVP